MYRKPAILTALTIGLAANLSAQNAYTENARKYGGTSRLFSQWSYPPGDIPIKFPTRLKNSCGSSYAQAVRGLEPASVTISRFTIDSVIVPPEFRGKSVTLRYSISPAGHISEIKLPTLSDSVFAKALRSAASRAQVSAGKLDGCAIATTVTRSVTLP